MDERTWDDARVQWLTDKAYKSSLSKDREIFAWFDQHLRGVGLTHIDRSVLQGLAQRKAAETSPSTANRHLALVRAILRRARDVWEWIPKCPQVPAFPPAPHRVRWLTHEEAADLLARLPSHQSAMARFALATGLRQRNVCRLRWCEVDLQSQCLRLEAHKTKNRKPLVVPINAAARAVLDAQAGCHPEFVFAYHGKPVWQVNTGTWKKALRAAGIENFRWHDLRHTWASWHAQAGTPFHVLQELGGWSSYEMVRRYAHLSMAHLAPHAERIGPI